MKSTTYLNIGVTMTTVNSTRQALIAKQAHLKDYLLDLSKEVKSIKDELMQIGVELSRMSDPQLDMFGEG